MILVSVQAPTLNLNVFRRQVLFWSGVSEQLTIETIPGCAELCPFEKFLVIVSDLVPSNDEYYCHPNRTMDESRDVTRKDNVCSSVSNVAVSNTWYCLLSLVSLVVLYARGIDR